MVPADPTAKIDKNDIFRYGNKVWRTAPTLVEASSKAQWLIRRKMLHIFSAYPTYSAPWVVHVVFPHSRHHLTTSRFRNTTGRQARKTGIFAMLEVLDVPRWQQEHNPLGVYCNAPGLRGREDRHQEPPNGSKVASERSNKVKGKKAKLRSLPVSLHVRCRGSMIPFVPTPLLFALPRLSRRYDPPLGSVH